MRAKTNANKTKPMHTSVWTDGSIVFRPIQNDGFIIWSRFTPYSSKIRSKNYKYRFVSVTDAKNTHIVSLRRKQNCTSPWLTTIHIVHNFILLLQKWDNPFILLFVSVLFCSYSFSFGTKILGIIFNFLNDNGSINVFIFNGR